MTPRMQAHPRLRSWLGDALAAAIIVAAAFAPFQGSAQRPSGLLEFAIVLAPAVLLPLRRRRPIPVLAAIVVLSAAAAVLGLLAPGVVLATAIAMFAVTNRSSRRIGLVVTGVTVVAVVLLSVVGAAVSPLDARAVQYAVTVLFAAAAGDATRSRREYIVAVTERAERAEQTRESEARRRVSEERLRIARDLHDAVAHQISVISLNAGVASSALDSRPEKAREALSTIRSAARSVLGEIGDLLEVLRTDEAAGTAPQPGLDRLDELVRRFGEDGLQITVRTEGTLDRIQGAADLVAYRVVQEALTNAHKHGAEHRAHVLVAVADERVEIVVANPVAAVAGPDPERGSGHGLLGLRERVASVRGTVVTGATPGGYRVAASLPLPQSAVGPSASLPQASPTAPMPSPSMPSPEEDPR
ncbi:sensor histidine kinase [Rathayibacter sp. VKM Ac-2928]|uniref:sensor histidine kinase n=1 Tax=Rathayibacter sp. VKM Ac-2928 TaxID=2929479 RepID=UPI001FB40AF2|nr:histidine kinase [Rathayibacter sp. VKM Ac-2928]MCJ1684114.1 histidine kinase [Rathayibacter sp. VKM Ac-2928]